VDLKEAAVLGAAAGRHWYYVSKGRALLRYLRGVRIDSVLDVGAGSVVFAELLLRETSAREATCVDPGYGSDRDQACLGKPLRFRRAVDRIDADLVLLLDVLEHVEDDAGCLARYADLARTGTHFLVSVPAGPWLWSRHDEFLGHVRRYRRRPLEALLRGAGLTVVRTGCIFALVLPAVAAIRLAELWMRSPRASASQLRRHRPWVNQGLIWLHRLELPLVGINRWCGLTIVTLARKDRARAAAG